MVNYDLNLKMIHLCKSQQSRPQEFIVVPCPYRCSGGYKTIQVTEPCKCDYGTKYLPTPSHGTMSNHIRCINPNCHNGWIITTKKVKCENPSCVNGFVKIPK